MLLPSPNNTILQNAQYFAHLSSATYQAAPDSYHRFTDLQITNYEAFRGHEVGATGLVARTESCLLLAFRGTNDVDAWVTNVNFRQVEGYGGRIHAGFGRALEGVLDPIVARLRTLQTKHHLPLWITGHSLGAALATLAAQRLKGLFRIAGTYTFGQPRVGNPSFARAYGAAPPLYRFVNNEDMVPQLPLPWMWFTYQHVGQVFYFDGQGRLSRHDQQWNKLATALAGLLLSRNAADAAALRRWAVEDHWLRSYVAKIEANLRNEIPLPVPAPPSRGASQAT